MKTFFWFLGGNMETWQLFRVHAGVICFLPGVSYFYSLRDTSDKREVVLMREKQDSAIQ